MQNTSSQHKIQISLPIYKVSSARGGGGGRWGEEAKEGLILVLQSPTDFQHQIS